MELLDPNASPEYALQCMKWCIETSDVASLEAHLRLHKNILQDEITSLLFDAFSKQSSEVMRIMLTELDQEIRTLLNTDEKSSLHKLLYTAVGRGDIEIVKALIEKGANIKANFYGRPLLHIAACSGHLDIFTELIKGKADIHSVDRLGDGIIHSILTSQLENKGEMIRQAITLGANPLVKSSSGKSPIHLASKNASDALEEIIRDGYDVNLLDDINKETPLHIACGAVCWETILTLIQSGCHFNITNNRGQTPLAKLLMFTNNSNDFHTKTRVNMAKVLISVGFKMNSTGQKKSNPESKGRDKCYDKYLSLKMSFRTPPRLQSLARLTVREAIQQGSGVVKEINKLDIPMNLKSYILCHDLKF